MNQKIRIALFGGPCTGKTTLADFVVQALRAQGEQAQAVAEFVSPDIGRNGPPEQANMPFEHMRYYVHQSRVEQAALQQVQVLLTDCPTPLICAYGLFNSPATTDERQELVLTELEALFAADIQNYDKIYLLRREFPYTENGVRYHTLEQAMAFDRLLEELFDRYNVSWTPLAGTVAERGAQVVRDAGYLLTQTQRLHLAEAQGAYMRLVDKP